MVNESVTFWVGLILDYTKSALNLFINKLSDHRLLRLRCNFLGLLDPGKINVIKA